jgi:CheY-like chemotaxis protein
MDTPLSKGVDDSAAAASRPPMKAEESVAEYFHEGSEGGSESKGFLSSLLSWLSPFAGARGADAPLRPSVLLVDDEPDGAEALLRMFEQCGYAVRWVASAEAALAAIRAERPGVVLVDIMMPGMDGVALLRAIRADPANASLPVLMLTADHRRMLEAFTSGAQDYLLKPVDFPRVRASVERELGASGGGTH